ncbi:non-ribosomal peptide synthetase [bacterium]|nr:non-ribosomal peptide synthetase [bacterium]
MDSIITAATSYPPASLNRWTEKFERQAELTPAQTAVISGNRELSYRELSESSDRIADRLRERGVGRGQVVGLGLHRSLDLPAAVLGIMKSGAAYLPLDPGFPAARIAQMIHSAKLQHVLTHRGLAAQFPNVGTLCVDEKSPAAVTGDSDSSENLRHWYSISLTLGTHDRTLIISSPSFDLTRRNFFGPLASGGTLILDDCQTPDIARIAALIGHHRVSLIQCTPDAFYPLVDATAQDGYRALHSLRFAVLGEVPISVTRLRAWLEHPQCRAEVVNLYGPSGCTEISGFQCLHRGNLGAPKSGSPRRAAIPPRSTISMESKILELWSEVLNHPVADATASFFELGGNLVHLAIAHVRLMDRVGRKFPITELPVCASARAVANWLSSQDSSTTPVARRPLGHAAFR